MQELDNAVADRNYLKAAKLALKLQQPGRLLSLVCTLLATPASKEPQASSGTMGQAALARLAAGLSEGDRGRALECARDWNTTARHCHAAQALVHALLATQRPQVRDCC